MGDVVIRSTEIKMVPLAEIRLNPENQNEHTNEQIEELSKVIKETGYRSPGIISNRSGYLIAGEGRFQAAKMAGMKEFPVIYQDFGSDEEEFAHSVADNAFARWSKLNLSGIDKKIQELGPFDLSSLGIKDFTVIPEYEEKKDKQKDPKSSTVVQCPNCGDQFDAKENKI